MKMCLTITAHAEQRKIIIYSSNGDTPIDSLGENDNTKKYNVNYQPPKNLLFDWNYHCSVDKFNGGKFCSLSKSNSEVMVSIYNNRLSVYVGKNHYPDSLSAIKIDSNQSNYGKEGQIQNPKKVIDQMMSGKTVFTRYQQWPYRYNQDSQVDLNGFAKEYAEMLREYQQL